MDSQFDVTIGDEQTIEVVLKDENPINVTINESDSEQPITVTIGSGSGSLDIFSNPPSGCYRIVNIYLDASKHIVVVYDETPVS